MNKEKAALIVWLIIIIASVIAVLSVPAEYVYETFIVTVMTNFVLAAVYFVATKKHA